MPLTNFHPNNGNPWALWKIEESEAELSNQIPTSSIPSDITNPRKRLEWYAGRRLVMHLMNTLGLSYKGIIKDPFGKPFPSESNFQLSLSHSFPHVAAYMHASESVGIDLEQPKSKLLNIAPRIFNEAEIGSSDGNLTKLCIFWCAKEVLVKVHGKKDLTFSKNLQIEPFSMNNTGDFVGRIIVNDTVAIVPLYYEIHEEFTVVLNKPTK